MNASMMNEWMNGNCRGWFKQHVYVWGYAEDAVYSDGVDH